ncbi:PDZ domain-containing protein [Aquimarina algiphila]|uniref:PDZ domain-containing protein n=1 Tax=Aquimarina algiphila TaxID=2047982 RepID=UPI0024914AED|nr:PDZ domain-containing protein [Aquimarina algiphila]
MQKLIVLIIFFFLIDLTCAQSAKEQLALANSVKLENNDFFEEISFQNKFGYFIIPVHIGNKNYEYIFDTGGYNTLTSEIMDKNKLPKVMEVEVGSSNQIKSKIILTKIPLIKIGDIDFKEIGAFNFDFDDSPQIKCYTNGGIIGKSIIKNAVWQVNAKEQKIILTDNVNKLKNLNNAIRIKVKLDKTFNPFIKAKINDKTLTFLLDFGYGGFISLTEKVGVNLNSQEVVEIIGEGSISANGIVNESMFIKTLESFKIGRSNLQNQVVYYSKSNNYNLIGSGITKHFIVTLNFKDQELLLTPIENTEKLSSKKSFGFDLNRNDNNVYVSKIFKDFSAEKAGLKLNDIVISINNKDITKSSYCDFYDYTKEILRGDEAIRLTIKRENVLQNIQVIKSNIFNLE